MNKSNRVANLFKNEKANIAYLTAGDGGIEKTLAAAIALIKGGVNMLEIGVPFSDPIADGPVIQRASHRAITYNTNLNDILALTIEIRKISDIPLILFSYCNPILNILHTSFLNDIKKAGIDGILLVDCPIEEAQLFHQQFIENQLLPIYVITPNTTIERIREIEQYAQGFLYYACRFGTTGTRNNLPTSFNDKIKLIKSISKLPIVVGFGISNYHMAQQVLHYADGVVVGSAFIKKLEDGATYPELTTFAKSIYFGEKIS